MRLAFDLTHTHFYQLTWAAKQEYMRIHQLDEVEPAATLFDRDVAFGLATLMGHLNFAKTKTLDTNQRGGLYELFLSRYYPPVESPPMETLNEMNVNIEQFLSSRDWTVANPAEMQAAWEQYVATGGANPVAIPTRGRVNRKVVPAVPVAVVPNTRVTAGQKAAATAAQARTQVHYQGKKYNVFNRTPSGGLRIPKTWVKANMGLQYGANVLVVGSAGFAKASHTVNSDGALYISAEELKNFDHAQIYVRRSGNNVVIKAV